MTDATTKLIEDLNTASDLMADTDMFPTGQAIMKDAAKTIAALQAENAKLREAAKVRPQYDVCIADAGQAYIESVAYRGEHTLPAMFRWQAFWDVLNDAALSGQDAEGDT